MRQPASGERRLSAYLAACRLALGWEAVAGAFWPVLAALCMAAGLALSGMAVPLPFWLHLGALLAVLVLLGVLLRRALAGLTLPGARDAERRLERDSSLAAPPARHVARPPGRR